MRILMLTIFLMSGICYAQERGHNVVMATLSDTTGVFDRVIGLLISNGYSIETESAKYGYINTGFKAWDYHSLSVRVAMDGQRVLFRGKMKSLMASAMGMGDAEANAEFTNSKSNIRRLGFDELVRLAQSLNPASITTHKE